MILVVGSDEDSTIEDFINILLEFNAEYVFLNQKYLLRGIEVSTEEINIFGKSFGLQEFTGVLNRLFDVNKNDLSNVPPKYLGAYQILNTIINNLMINVLNKDYFGISNDSKLMQLMMAKANKLFIPKHIVLAGVNINNNLAKYSNARKHIVKSLSSIRSIASIYESEEGSLVFPESSTEPVLFQEMIYGNNIRVHILDTFVYAVEIKSSSVDYRYCSEDDIESRLTILPRDIEQECLEIADRLNLRFCGIDLIIQDNKYYLLEVNPAPGWTYFENMIGNHDLSKQIMYVLSGKTF